MSQALRILLVEDDENKRSQISSALRELDVVDDVRDARSYKSGLRALMDEPFDLVMLDMTLPMFDVGPGEPGGETKLYAGRDLLRQMQRRQIDTPAIVVTQYTSFGEGSEQVTLDELDNQLRSLHHTQYKGHVYYDAVQESWRRQLARFVSDFAHHREGYE